jgi:hypothetical protein
MLIYTAPLIVWSIVRIMQKILTTHPTKTNLVLSLFVMMILSSMISNYMIKVLS